MAFVFQKRYEPHVEDRMRAFWQTLSERDRRRFAALEAARLGFGGLEYVAEVLGCSARTIERGADGLDQKAEYSAGGNPVFSLDTKAKEHLGQLFRKGRVWTQQAFQAFDHDFPSCALASLREPPFLRLSTMTQYSINWEKPTRHTEHLFQSLLHRPFAPCLR